MQSNSHMSGSSYISRLLFSNTIRNLFILVYLLLAVIPAFGQRLNLFTSATGMPENGDVIPYDHVAGYFDAILNDQPADSTDGKHNFYFLYFYVPVEVNEIGIRLISPVPAYASPQPGDFETDAYESRKKQETYFNPGFVLEQRIVMNVESKEEITWVPIGKNNDSDELLAQPNGKHTNALLRVHDTVYPAGIYRVRFFSEMDKDISASYLIQAGTVPAIKRMKLSRSLSGL